MRVIALYKGYLRGESKHAATKIIGKKLLSFETVRKEQSYVGVLSNEYIMVDVDNKEDANKLLNIIDDQNIKCSVLETNHGMHFYFGDYELRSNKIKWWSAVGIMCDYKLGIKNTADPLRIDGHSRKWLRKTTTYSPFPIWLTPISNKQNNLDGMREGEGRNQKLFNYILTLQNVGMSREQIKDTIRLINKHILADPLPGSEINTILRNDAFLKESFFNKGTFLHDKFAKFLISEHHIILIANTLHIYKDGVYSDDVSEIEKAMIQHISSLNQARRREVLAYLQLQAEEKQLADVNYIAVHNGIYNLDKDELQPFTPDIILKNKIPVDFVAGAYSEVTDHTLNKIAVNDQRIRLIFEEIFGYVLFRRNEIGKAFILTGDGSNGKSSFLKIIRDLIGTDNTSSLDLKELSQRFKTAELFGKLANIGDDISNEFIKDNSEFKKLTTGEPLNVERKGKDPFDFANYAKLIFSANKMPRINDTSNGLTRRLMFIPFKAKFSVNDADFDPFITDKLQSDESMQYVLQLGIKGLRRLLKNHKFTSSKAVSDEADKYEELNNPIIAYLKEESPNLIGESAKDSFNLYLTWCTDNGYKAVSQIQFSREVCRLEKLETKVQRIDGKPQRIFVKNG